MYKKKNINKRDISDKVTRKRLNVVVRRTVKAKPEDNNDNVVVESVKVEEKPLDEVVKKSKKNKKNEPSVEMEGSYNNEQISDRNE